jgi:putative DNA primase/helicase
VVRQTGGGSYQRLRWSAAPQAAGWYEWNRTHWQATADRAPLKLQLAVRQALAAGVTARAFDGRTLARLESAGAIRGIGALMAAWPLMRLPDATDPPELLACPRGVLDLASGQWLEHDPLRAITRCCPVDPGPTCAAWEQIERHLADCLGSVYPAVQRFLGSALLGLGADRRLLWLTGPGGDGKSTLVSALLAALGSYVEPMAAETFSADGRSGAHAHELASGLATARLAVALEVSPRVNWSLLKTLSGGDRQKTKRTHGRAFTYERPPCLLLVSNDTPHPPDAAAAERVILARLRPPDDADERIVTTLKTPGKARDAIAGACLSWLLRGCSDYLAHGRNLGPIPHLAGPPTALDRWWADAVASGRLIPGGAPRTPLEVIRQDLIATGVEPVPNNHELSAFLKSVVEFKRTTAGRFYAVVMTPYDAI